MQDIVLGVTGKFSDTRQDDEGRDTNIWFPTATYGGQLDRTWIPPGLESERSFVVEAKCVLHRPDRAEHFQHTASQSTGLEIRHCKRPCTYEPSFYSRRFTPASFEVVVILQGPRFSTSAIVREAPETRSTKSSTL
jgi:hypothetical protein